ncbi:MAG: replicative DNA helicase [Candidatus Vogelbacteria bacterium CG10_big_fil_rev_8_21_14_0_10_45_14]|uniref:Replicative DNA helicase n=1 Tax=Candidatus Vogelbacteria bacterium CG10_big_fil_rev_8_21_14_0_10_45_14 TaxID=1975042 RepID=A0A2H0RJJ9_9BACT|nr:MAG: replicative DNA helicase [Candidatus Vogelbacteria bacterium CG10_big_fil_rev_8_21_14_0_10_45_14]
MDNNGRKGESRTQNIRIPPQNIDAERALLGAIMLKPLSLIEIVDTISARSFYSDRHRMIFESMLELYQKSDPIDLLTITSKIREKKLLDRAGGASYLAELATSTPSTSNANYYAELIQKKFVHRSLIESAEKISDLGFSENEDIDNLVDRAEKEIFSITNVSKQRFVPIRETLTDAWERLDHLHKTKDEIRGVRSGFPEIDNKLAGLQKSDLIILAARPSVGKTSLALDIARNAAVKNGVPTGIFSLEMSSQQLVDRMLAAESHVDSWKLRTGRLTTDEEFSKIRDAMDKLSQAPIFIDDDSANTALKMRSVARRLKAEHGLGLIVVDYLQLMVPQKNVDSLVQQVTEISRSLKHMARELDVPVLALSQLSRAVEQRGGEPRLSDLRDSGSIEQDADVVMFIHRGNDRDQSENEGQRATTAKIIIAKHRNGPTGACELFFDEKRVSFTSINKSDFGGF